MKSVEYFTHSTLSDVLNHTMNFWSQKSDCETKQTDLAAAQGKKLLIKQRIPGWIGLARRPTVFEATYEINLKPVPDGTQIRVNVNFPFKARISLSQITKNLVDEFAQSAGLTLISSGFKEHKEHVPTSGIVILIFGIACVILALFVPERSLYLLISGVFFSIMGSYIIFNYYKRVQSSSKKT